MSQTLPHGLARPLLPGPAPVAGPPRAPGGVAASGWRWKLRRLAAMSPPELLHRVAEQVLRLTARGRAEGWARHAVPPQPLPAPVWDTTALSDTARAAVATAARPLLAGRFEALGTAWPARDPDDLFPRTLWTLDPVSGRHWPAAAYCFDIDWRNPRAPGDAKRMWEVNRLQILPPLALHLALTGEDAAALALTAAVDSWMAANPPFRGPAWGSGIECALRALSLSLMALLAGPALPGPVQDRLPSLLAAHLFWIRRFPSRFSSANNHRVAEAAAECVTGLLWPGLPGAAAAARAGRASLIREIPRQILADGAPAEQSPAYGAFTAELALLAVAVARSRGAAFPAIVTDRLAAFAEFVTWAGESGAGDDDEGRVMSLGVPEADYPQSVARSLSAFLAHLPAGGTARATPPRPGPAQPPRSQRPAPSARATSPDPAAHAPDQPQPPKPGTRGTLSEAPGTRATHAEAPTAQAPHPGASATSVAQANLTPPGPAAQTSPARAEAARPVASASEPATLRSLLFGATPLPLPFGLRSFPEGGISAYHGMLSGRRARLTLDHGPLGYLAIAAHGHADALSITLALDGEPVLVDPGTYAYHGGGAWRDWFRGTPAHNTLTLAGENQSRITGPFNWAAHAQARLLSRTETRLTAEHDGYLARFGAMHRRSLLLTPSSVLIEDSLPGAAAGLPVSLTFQFAPGCSVDTSGTRVRVTRGAVPLLALGLPPGLLSLTAGAEGPAGGWVSPGFGRRLPAPRLVWTGVTGEGPLRSSLTVLPRG